MLAATDDDCIDAVRKRVMNLPEVKNILHDSLIWFVETDFRNIDTQAHIRLLTAG